MKRIIGIIVAGGALILLIGAATAHWEGGDGGPGRGRGIGYGMGYGIGHGHGMGWGAGPDDFQGRSGPATETAPLTEEKAKELAEKYAEQFLAGFKVEKVLPFTGMHHTAYAIELKNSEGELRTFHVNPFGNVVPFGGPYRHGS